MPALINLLTNAPHLTKLNLSDNPITHRGIQSLATFLETNQRLISLDLGDTSNVEGIKSLAQYLKNNSTLIELRLTTTYRSDNNYKSRVTTAMTRPLSGQVIDDFYQSLDELLKVNHTLTILNIPHTSVIPQSPSKLLSLWAKIKDWLSAKWGKLSNVISNAWNSLKNTLGLTPKKRHIESNDQSKKMPLPPQTAHLPPKETSLSKEPKTTTSSSTSDLTQGDVKGHPLYFIT